MSVDESDDSNHSPQHRPNYSIRPPAWRGLKVARWLRSLDKTYGQENDPNLDGVQVNSNWLLNRIEYPNMAMNTKPVHGLPICFYEPEWLNRLSIRDRLDLTSREDCDLDGMIDELV